MDGRARAIECEIEAVFEESDEVANTVETREDPQQVVIVSSMNERNVRNSDGRNSYPTSKDHTPFVGIHVELASSVFSSRRDRDLDVPARSVQCRKTTLLDPLRGGEVRPRVRDERGTETLAHVLEDGCGASVFIDASSREPGSARARLGSVGRIIGILLLLSVASSCHSTKRMVASPREPRQVAREPERTPTPPSRPSPSLGKLIERLDSLALTLDDPAHQGVVSAMNALASVIDDLPHQDGAASEIRSLAVRNSHDRERRNRGVVNTETAPS